jgi:hypothetical protein
MGARMDERRVFPLEYASPRERKPMTLAARRRWRGRAVGAFRQLLFAIGLALLAAGVGRGLPQFSNEASDQMAWGGFIIGVAFPLRGGNRFW